MIKTEAISMTTQPEVTMMMHGQKTRFTKFEKMVAVFSSFMNHNKNNIFNNYLQYQMGLHSDD